MSFTATANSPPRPRCSYISSFNLDAYRTFLIEPPASARATIGSKSGQFNTMRSSSDFTSIPNEVLCGSQTGNKCGFSVSMANDISARLDKLDAELSRIVRNVQVKKTPSVGDRPSFALPGSQTFDDRKPSRNPTMSRHSEPTNLRNSGDVPRKPEMSILKKRRG